jgi:hypothetical protein
MRKELRGAALPGVDVPCSGQKEEAGRVRCYGAHGGVSRQCDEVKAMVASGTIAAPLCSDAHSRCSPGDRPDRSPVGLSRDPKGLLCRTRNSLGLFRLRSRFLAFYGHLKRLTQYIVVANCAFPHEHEQVAPRRVFHGLLAQRWGI